MAAMSGLFFRSKFESIIKAAWEKDDHKELRILVTGKTGEGKSTLVNGLLGKHVAKEGAGPDRCTSVVAEYKAEIQGVPVTVFDSPGLQDTTENEDQYIADMRKKCQDLSLVLYCTKMTNNRLKEEDKRAIVKLTAAFGQKFWNHAVLVLTFANTESVGRRDERDEDEGSEPDFNDTESWKVLKKRRFEGRVKIWKESFHKFLMEDVSIKDDIVKRIFVVPVGDSRKTIDNPYPYHLPDRDDWFTEFWKACSLRVREMNLFCEINKHRFTGQINLPSVKALGPSQTENLPSEVITDKEGLLLVPVEETSSQASPDISIDAQTRATSSQKNLVSEFIAVLAEKCPELSSTASEEFSEIFLGAKNIEEPLVQDSTLRLSDTPEVDETYSEDLLANMRKINKEAWVKEQEEKNEREKEKIEREAEKNKREAEENRKERERIEQLQSLSPNTTNKGIHIDQDHGKQLFKEAVRREHGQNGLNWFERNCVIL